MSNRTHNHPAALAFRLAVTAHDAAVRQYEAVCRYANTPAARRAACEAVSSAHAALCEAREANNVVVMADLHAARQAFAHSRYAAA